MVILCRLVNLHVVLYASFPCDIIATEY